MTAVDLPRRPGRPRRRGRRDGQLSAGPGTYVLLGVIVFVSLFPLYWTFVAASRSNSDINRVPPSLFPGRNAFPNVAHAFQHTATRAAAVLGMLTFMTTWNDFYWPRVVMTPQNPTVQVALSTLAGGYLVDYSVLLAGALIATLPMLVVFALMGRQILDGIMQGAIKA